MRRLIFATPLLLGLALAGLAHAQFGVGLLFNGGTAPLAPGYYVATGGNDSNPGTLASPFLTLGKCQTAMRAGLKYCYVRAGAYAPGSAGTGCGDTQGAVLLLTSSDNGETWSYYPPDGYGSADIDGGASGNSGVGWGICSSADDITVNGLKFTNFQVSGITSTGAAPLIENNTIVGITNTARATYAIGTGNAANGQILHNYIDNATEIGIGSWPSSAHGVDNLLIAYNFIKNTMTAQTDAGGIYIENNGGEPQAGEIVEYNYVQDVGAGGGGISIYLDDLSSDITVSGNVMRGQATGWSCGFVHGGSSNAWTGNICDEGSGGSQEALAAQWESGTMTGNAWTNNIIVANSSGAAGAGYVCNSSPCQFTLVDNGYYNYGGSSVVYTGSLGTDSTPTYANPSFTCGWEYTLPGGSSVYSAPVSFPAQPASWGTAGFWGPPGFTVPQTGTAPAPPHTC